MFKNLFDTSQQDVQEHFLLAAHIAEIKEWDNRPHLDRVRRYVLLLATGLGVSQNEARLISIASILHDIGKITIPESIQKKTANLEPHEWKIAEQHTLEGARLLRGSDSAYLQAAEIIALTHHERWDGSGYPHRMNGSEIPLSGRLCAVADVFDALTTSRPYKQENSAQEAYQLIVDASGTLFDPEIVAVFQRSFDEIQKILKTKKLS